MLGQPVSMLTPSVVGFRLHGELPEGATATDLVLTVTELLRDHGVVGKFVEFHGPGVGAVPLEHRATIGNMSPEYGSTCAIFPIDAETLRYLRFTGRAEDQVALVEAYAKEQGLWHEPDHEPRYSEHVELDLGTVVPSLAGPARPQDRVPLDRSKELFREALGAYLEERVGGADRDRKPGVPSQALPFDVAQGTAEDASAESFPASDPPAAMEGVTDDGEPDNGSAPSAEARRPDAAVAVDVAGGHYEVDHGHVVIAAITSCTNTSNPDVMMAAGLLARNAVARGLTTKPWVKASLAPGSRVVTDYLDRARLTSHLEALRFHLVGYGCTTCIGNSGPLDPPISQAIAEHDLSVAAVLSGNRNFEGRINPDVRMNYLASPPLVVAYALAGTLDWDPTPSRSRAPTCSLADVWPSVAEISAAVAEGLGTEMFTARYAQCSRGRALAGAGPSPPGSASRGTSRRPTSRQPPVPRGDRRPTRPAAGHRRRPGPGRARRQHHHRPHLAGGTIAASSPAGRWLQSRAWRQATSARTAPGAGTTR
jgi:aconitate hydratase